MSETSNSYPLGSEPNQFRMYPNPKPVEDILKGPELKKISPFFDTPQWNDWQWQVRNQISSIEELEKWVSLSITDKRALQYLRGKSTFSITPYWASLIDSSNYLCPIRKQTIPLAREMINHPDEKFDLNEDKTIIANGRLVHGFSDRTDLNIHSRCVAYCSHCPHDSLTEKKNNEDEIFEPSYTITQEEWDESFDYILHHPQIREVILTGGEPLLLNDLLLERIFTGLKSIPSVKSIRVETRILSVLPQRITDSFIKILKDSQPLYVIITVNHPREITKSFIESCAQLIDSGIPIVSQSLLLRKVNDQPHILYHLFMTLYDMRIRTHRIYQCQPILGMEHLRTTISKGLRLMKSLREKMNDLAIPDYVVHTSGGLISLSPETIITRNKKRVLLKNIEGKVFVYPENNFSFSY